MDTPDTDTNTRSLEHKVDIVTTLIDKLDRSNRRHALVQHIIKLGHWTLDIVNNELHWSDEVYSIFGLDSETFDPSYEVFLNAIHPDDRALVDKAYTDSLKNRTLFSIDHRLLMPDGTVKWVNECCETDFAEDGTALFSTGTVHDVTQRKIDETKIRQLSATYAALSHCNQAIIHSTNEDELLPKICHSAVESGAIKMAWIGMLDETGFILKPVAAFGYGMDYLEGREIAVHAKEQNSQNPISTAIHTNRPFWCQDLLHESLDSQWHELSQQYGWGSMASLPLHRKSKVIGTFNLYASEANSFDQAIGNLLIEMTTDIDYALKVYDLQAEHRLLEESNRSQIHHLESLQRIADVSASAQTVDDMIASVIEETRNIFNSDRAWLLYPCDPNADYFEITAESTSADYPGAFANKKRLPMSATIKTMIEDVMNSTDPIVYCPMPAVDAVIDQYAVRSMIIMIIRPNYGKPGIIGLHQCSDERLWTDDEQILLKSIAARMPDLLSSAHLNRDLQKLSRAVQHAGEAVLITDRNAVVEYVNPIFTEITGYMPEDIIGKTTAVLNSGLNSPEIYSTLWDTISKGHIWRGTLIDKRKDGSTYPALTSIAPIFNDVGNITNYVAHQQDITERTRLEEQFLQSQKMEAIGTLVGGIAHDFNNMLGAIMGNVFLTRKFSKNQTEIGNRLDNIEKLSMRAADMVQQLLTFARKNQVEKSHLSLTNFIIEAYQLAKTAIPENINLVFEPGEEDFLINADSTQLQQVLMNLLNNARDAVANVSQPKISCKLSPYIASSDFIKLHPKLQSSKLTRLTIKDNGCGISEQDMKKIFEPFFTTKNVGEGTGLGLAMVFGAVHSHGGVLEVESQPGEGASFHIILPLIGGEEDFSDNDLGNIIHGQQESILLVDDEDDLLEITAELLIDLGYKVLKAGNGAEALKVFKKHHHDIDLILTDVVMPKIGGIELAISIREVVDNVPVIFATGYSKENIMGSDNQLEHSALISKPFSLVEISQLIRKMINNV